MGRVIRRPAARRDLIQNYIYLYEHAGEEVAKRFREAVERTYQDLAATPGMGAPGKITKDPALRLWRVRGFESYLIAYEEHRDGVAIKRLFHAAQDYTRVLNT